MKKPLIYGLTATLLLLTFVTQAQMRPAGPSAPKTDEKLYSQSFADTPLEMLVDFYNEWVGRTLIIQADLSPTISLKFSKLTKDEAMQAIESVLAMNGVALVPMGDKFLKVVPIANARQEGMEIRPFDEEENDFAAADQLISQIIPLRYVVFADVQPVIQHLIHGYGKVIELQRINSVLVTDTSANVARIVEALEMLDQPLEKIEPRIYQLNHAKAADIAGKLKELVEAARPESNPQQQVVARAKAPPGVIRAAKTAAGTVTAAGPATDDTQMVQGDVKFVSDERTNILIIFSKAANFDFFDRIIKVLDVSVDPEVVVETINLEYAEASEIAGILNDFVGAVKREEETTKSRTGDDTESGEDRNINDVIARRGGTQQQVPAATASAIGRLSEDTKIISDERTNALILMGSKSDIKALKTVIASLDIMLQQVMIEAVILNVNVGDQFATGMDWVYQKGMNPSMERSFGPKVSGITTNVLSAVATSSFKYYQTIPGLDTKFLISAAKSDSDTRLLSTPVVLTTDNTEAKITVANENPVITSSVGSSAATSTYGSRSTYQYKTIGLELTVTPRINPNNFVLMEINQSADELGKDVEIDENKVPTILKREISATVGVKDRETIILGGLVSKSKRESATKIPLLGDIPLLGWLFNSRSDENARDELIVLLTPYVLNTPEEANAESERRFEASDSKTTEWPRGWSLSELANDEPEAEQSKNKDKQPAETDEDESPEALEKEARIKELEQMLEQRNSGE